MVESFYIADPKGLDSESERLSKILNSKYKPTDLYEYVSTHMKFTEFQREQFLCLMQKYETLFDGTLGKWKCKLYHIKLKEICSTEGFRNYS